MKKNAGLGVAQAKLKNHTFNASKICWTIYIIYRNLLLGIFYKNNLFDRTLPFWDKAPFLIWYAIDFSKKTFPSRFHEREKSKQRPIQSPAGWCHKYSKYFFSSLKSWWLMLHTHMPSHMLLASITTKSFEAMANWGAFLVSFKAF